VPNKVTGLKRMLHLASFAISMFPIAVWHSFKKYDLVFTVEPSLLNSFSALMIAKFSGAKSNLHVQDFEVDVAFELGIVKSKRLKSILLRVERSLMSLFDMVSTSSPAMVSLLHNKGVDPEKTYLFPNWVDISQIYPIDRMTSFRSELKISSNTVVLLYSGNMGEKQGLEIVIDSARMLQNRNTIVIMCGTGTAINRLKERAEGLSNIIWLDLQPLERLNDLLNTADIHLLPQLEGASDLLMPSKLNGMLASGRPIVATALDGTQIEKVVAKCGIVTPPADVNEFVGAIEYLIDNQSLVNELGRAARDYALNWLEYNAIMMKYEKKIETL
jgi:colanic acid biosynthesis glycosyl transferase WcaI